MTEEYKKVLFEVIMGHVNTSPSSTDEIYIDKITNTWDLYTEIPEADADSITINGMFKGSNNYALYGEYYNSTPGADWENCGFIIIVDNDFNILQTLTKYDSGTYFRAFSNLQQAEDNTYYGVDYYTTYTPRFIMLNNFTIPDDNGNYKVKLRYSLNFADTDFIGNGSQIFKNPNSSHYVFVSMSEGSLKFKAIDLVVNVGEANTWTSINTNYEYMENAYVDFDSQDRAFIQTLTNYNGYIRRVYKDYSASTFVNTNVVASVDSSFIQSVAYLNSTDFYFVYNSIVKNVGSNTYSLNNGVPEFTKLIMNNGDLYILYSNNGTFYYQRYTGTWQPIPITNTSVSSDYSFLKTNYIFSNYNMLKIINANPTGYTVITEDYNKNNYNSRPYVDSSRTAILPSKARLFTNGKLSFARNDYNISYLGNTYTTTVEIPNTYLNGDTINPSQLIGKTNIVLVNYTENLVKNIYENVYLNFINSINSYDEDTGNVFDTSTLVKNISGLGNTNKASMSFYFTSKNGVRVDVGLTNRVIVGRLTGRIDAGFTASGDADRISFCNADYVAFGYINYNFESGKQYSVHQFVRLADIPLGNQNVIWNDNQVQFNGKDVVYLTSI